MVLALESVQPAPAGAPPLPAEAALADPMVGRRIGARLHVTSLIARGGMGNVYRAEQAPSGRPCRLKLLNPNYAGEAGWEFHKRFFLEAAVASKLTHPNTVTIFDYGRTDDDIYYMAMEYLDGHTLHRAIREGGLPRGARARTSRGRFAAPCARRTRSASSIATSNRQLFLVDARRRATS